MTAVGVLQIALFLGLIFLCAKPLGSYMAKVFEGRRTFLHPLLRWLEVLTYKAAGIREDVEQRWTQIRHRIARKLDLAENTRYCQAGFEDAMPTLRRDFFVM